MRYPYVVLHVPRRAGKSAAVLAALTHRLATGRGRRAWYTAQTRADAALTFRDSWTPMLTTSPLHPRFLKLRQSNGSEGVTFRPTGSSLTLFAPGATALHGQDADAAVVDEAWTLTLEGGGALEAGIQPAALSRPHRQLWVVSAGGTHASAWLDHWLTLGRDGTDGVAVVDYGATDSDDLDDPDVWARVHPAVGHTVTLDAIAGMRSTIPAQEFARAVCGLWTPADATPVVLEPGLWRDAFEADAAPRGLSLAFGLETAHDGSATTIVAASVDEHGRTVLEVVEQAPGLDWLPGYWRDLRARYRARLYADELGPTAAAVDRLRRARLPLEVLTTSEYVTACAQLLDDLRRPTLLPDDRVSPGLVHRAQPLLDAAAAVATSRPVGDRWVWSRRGRPEVAPLVAATVAAHGARNPPSRPTGTVVAG